MSRLFWILLPIVMLDSMTISADSAYDNSGLRERIYAISDSLRTQPQVLMKEVDYDRGNLKIPAHWMMFWTNPETIGHGESGVTTWHYGDTAISWASITCFNTLYPDCPLEKATDMLHKAKLINSSTAITYDSAKEQWDATEQTECNTRTGVVQVIRDIHIRKFGGLYVLTIQHLAHDSIAQQIADSWQISGVTRTNWPDVDDLPMRLYD